MNLCLHGIGTPRRPLEDSEATYWLEVAQFEEVVHVVSRHPFFRITIDDGNDSDVTTALPILLAHNLSATFFIVAGRLNQPGFLRTEDVEHLVRSGMRVGSHGMFHRSWRSVPSEDLHTNLSAATQIISEAAGAPIFDAACPYGFYDRRVLNVLRRHDFTRVYTPTRGARTRPLGFSRGPACATNRLPPPSSAWRMPRAGTWRVRRCGR